MGFVLGIGYGLMVCCADVNSRFNWNMEPRLIGPVLEKRLQLRGRYAASPPDQMFDKNFVIVKRVAATRQPVDLRLALVVVLWRVARIDDLHFHLAPPPLLLRHARGQQIRHGDPRTPFRWATSSRSTLTHPIGRKIVETKHPRLRAAQVDGAPKCSFSSKCYIHSFFG